MTSAERLRAALRRGIPIVVVAMACGAIALVVYGSRTAPQFTAESHVLLPSIDVGALATDGQSSFDPAHSAAAAVAIASSPTFDRAVSRSVYGTEDRWEDVGNDLTASTDASNTVLAFDAETSSGAGAVRLANAAARTYLPYQREVLGAPLRQAIADLEQRLKAHPKYGDTRAALSRLQVLAAVSASGASISDLAQGSDRVVHSRARDVLVGLAAGLVVGLLIVALREAADLRVRSTPEAEELAGAPVLAHLPGSVKAVGVHESGVRTSGDIAIGRALVDRGWRSVVLIGPAARAARLGIATRVAQGLANGGRAVLIGDSEGDVAGIAQLLPEAAATDHFGDPGGAVTIIASDDLAKHGWERLLNAAAHEFDCAVISAPWPVERIGMNLIAALDGAVLVFDRSTTRSDVRRAVAALDRLAVPLLGVVMAV